MSIQILRTVAGYYLPVNEQSALNWIYPMMPGWQPLFYGNKVLPAKITLPDNWKLSIESFEQ